MHSMTPFFGCVSFGPLLDGRCGNCLWHEQHCTFEEVQAGETGGDPAAVGKVKFDVNKAPVPVSLSGLAKVAEVEVDLDRIVAEQKAFVERKARLTRENKK